MARIQVTDLKIDEALDARALKLIWGGAGKPLPRVRGLATARDLTALLDRALSRRAEGT